MSASEYFADTVWYVLLRPPMYVMLAETLAVTMDYMWKEIATRRLGGLEVVLAWRYNLEGTIGFIKGPLITPGIFHEEGHDASVDSEEDDDALISAFVHSLSYRNQQVATGWQHGSGSSSSGSSSAGGE
eukprot:1432076-Karenia_brevis.AAC.1